MTRSFHAALDEALAATGMSVAELCRRAGVSDDQVNKFMQRGRLGKPVTTNVDDAAKLANALGLTLDEMLQDETATLRSEAASLWRELSDGERRLLRAAARGMHADADQPP